jgi:putative endonuclease
MWFVYILRCTDGSLYTGITTDLDRRIEEHRSGTGAKYTRSRTVEGFVYTAPFPTRSEALKREAEIKGWKREQKIALIKTQMSA